MALAGSLSSVDCSMRGVLIAAKLGQHLVPRLCRGFPCGSLLWPLLLLLFFRLLGTESLHLTLLHDQDDGAPTKPDPLLVLDGIRIAGFRQLALPLDKDCSTQQKDETVAKTGKVEPDVAHGGMAMVWSAMDVMDVIGRLRPSELDATLWLEDDIVSSRD